MSIIVENEKCMQVQHTLPLGMNEIFHNQVTTLNVSNYFLKIIKIMQNYTAENILDLFQLNSSLSEINDI